MKSLIKSLGGETLSDIHPSFHNKSKVGSLLRREILNNYPEGTDWRGK